MRYKSSIKDKIYEKGYTIDSFCKRVGICKHTIFNIEKKKHKARPFTKELIAQGLNISYKEVNDLCR